ncbi:LysR substrate-binding domain-containing protein [Klebsiella pneumoniae subsp. pneumoniae]|nr:LysR substrate-binding domain-containing protein [Klebsiella pneumoniae subsp. pneumoniae]
MIRPRRRRPGGWRRRTIWPRRSSCRCWLGYARPLPAVGWRYSELQPARLEQQAASDTVDLFFHTREGAPPELHQRLLFRERYVLAGRAEHSALRPGLSLETFCQLEHVIVSPDAGRLQRGDRYRAGEPRTDAAGCPFRATFPCLCWRPCAIAIWWRSCRSGWCAGRAGWWSSRPPLAVAGFEMLMLWHERWHRDPAHQWLRQFIVNSLEEQTC